jgi:XTP/dITP diphosphohydrolase
LSTILLSTRNSGKARELKILLADIPVEVKTLLDYPEIGEIEETGRTFEENADIKAVTVFKETGLVSLADDSGLAVDALDGAPGIHSARYAPTDQERVAKLLSELGGVPQKERTARFVCAMTLAVPDNNSSGGMKLFRARGICEGIIADVPKGENGFGYDPIMYLPDRDMTMAQITLEEKNRISHRGRAVSEMAKIIKRIIKD